MAVQQQLHKPTGAFVGAYWAVLFIGTLAYLIGLWNADMQLNEKGYYLTVLLYGLFSAVSLQKTVRDRMEGIRVTGIYYGLCWTSFGLAVLLLSIGLWNATLELSEKGFYAMSFVLSLFSAIAVQKNVRDLASMGDDDEVVLADVEA
ncbi:hypothetical protein GRF61_05935 [Azoarcus sp. TTM-91]|uniref:inner membrane protein YiaA n=1 Tax=Azoarcus sp. TTM-91 TaxID=2691581 RepID=UPI00145E8DAB|nr:inner membrane protein YiaA [Azoarcus sp. TTM-91]NMG33989.1 hypothetical protein [Azoarcus sp. TTM-91]